MPSIVNYTVQPEIQCHNATDCCAMLTNLDGVYLDDLFKINDRQSIIILISSFLMFLRAISIYWINDLRQVHPNTIVMYSQIAASSFLWAVGIPQLAVCDNKIYGYGIFVSDSFGWNDIPRALNAILHM